MQPTPDQADTDKALHDRGVREALLKHRSFRDCPALLERVLKHTPPEENHE